MAPGRREPCATNAAAQGISFGVSPTVCFGPRFYSNAFRIQRMRVVELSTYCDILERRAENPKLHSKRFRNSLFAASQSKTSTRPAARSASVLRNSASCHDGLENALSSATTSPQSASMIRSFSSAGSFRSSAMLMGSTIAWATPAANDFRPETNRTLQGRPPTRSKRKCFDLTSPAPARASLFLAALYPPLAQPAWH